MYYGHCLAKDTHELSTNCQVFSLKKAFTQVNLSDQLSAFQILY